LNYDVVIGSDMLWTTKRAAIISPQYRHRVEIELSHPLLKDFGIEATTAPREAAKIARTVAEGTLDVTELDVLAGVVVAYWTVYGLNALKTVYQQAIRQVAAHRASFEALPDRMKPEPALAGLPEAALATWQVQLSRIESERIEAERELLLNSYGDEELTPQLMRRGIRPSDRPTLRPIKLTLKALTKRALANRPAISTMADRIREQRLRVALAQNRQRPQLDAFMKLGLHSFSGEQTLGRDGYNQVTVRAPSQIRGQYGDAWGQLFAFKLPYLFLGLRFRMPVSGALRARQLALEEAELRRLEVQHGLIKTQTKVDVRRAYQLSLNDETRFRQSQAAYEGIAQRLQQVEEGFKRKAVSPQVVVQLVTYLRDTGVELARAAAAYMISRARLERKTGTLRAFLQLDPRSSDSDDAIDKIIDGPARKKPSSKRRNQ
jgi:outer membrane protein TolC